MWAISFNDALFIFFIFSGVIDKTDFFSSFSIDCSNSCTGFKVNTRGYLFTNNSGLIVLYSAPVFLFTATRKAIIFSFSLRWLVCVSLLLVPFSTLYYRVLRLLTFQATPHIHTLLLFWPRLNRALVVRFLSLTGLFHHSA